MSSHKVLAAEKVAKTVDVSLACLLLDRLKTEACVGSTHEGPLLHATLGWDCRDICCLEEMMESSDRWKRVRLNSFVFPNVCCQCGVQTERVEDAYCGRSFLMRQLESVLGFHKYAIIPVPVCDACAKRRGGRTLKRIGVGLAVGLLLCIGLVMILVEILPRGHFLSSLIPAIVLLTTPVVFYVLGLPKKPIRFRNYNAKDSTLEVHCARQDFEDMALWPKNPAANPD